MARPRSNSIEAARELALSWKSDLLEAFSYGEQQTAVSWTIDLATETDAARLVSTLGFDTELLVQQSGAQVRLLRASGELPPALLGSGP